MTLDKLAHWVFNRLFFGFCLVHFADYANKCGVIFQSHFLRPETFHSNIRRCNEVFGTKVRVLEPSSCRVLLKQAAFSDERVGQNEHARLCCVLLIHMY